MNDVLVELNPAAIQRQIQALSLERLTLTTSKSSARNKAAVEPTSSRASAHQSTTTASRAS